MLACSPPRSRRATSVLMLACALPLLTACQPRTVTDPSRAIYCEVMPDAPGRDNDDRPTKVIGKVRFRCDAPGASNLHLTVSVQKQNSGGTWVNQAQLTFTARGAETVPAGAGFQSREVRAACAEGVFRTFVSGTSTARGTTKRYERAGPRSFDPCRPSLFAER